MIIKINSNKNDNNNNNNNKLCSVAPLKLHLKPHYKNKIKMHKCIKIKYKMKHWFKSFLLTLPSSLPWEFTGLRSVQVWCSSGLNIRPFYSLSESVCHHLSICCDCSAFIITLMPMILVQLCGC